MLSIQDLHVTVGDKSILSGVNLQVAPGKIYAIMGPNGSGKSTLANVLAGHEGYEITKGAIEFEGQDLSELSPQARAHLGLFLAFQYPIEIPGVSNINFLKASYNALKKSRGEQALDAVEFIEFVKKKIQQLKMPEDFLYRSLNAGFSGGEKKRNEILQLAVMQPKLAILDETDSGLDIDALKIVADGVNAYHHQDTAIIVVTHYQRLLNYLVPDEVHVLANGRLVHSGDKQLAMELENKGYAWITQELADGRSD